MGLSSKVVLSIGPKASMVFLKTSLLDLEFKDLVINMTQLFTRN
jgi:hypothetical protein